MPLNAEQPLQDMPLYESVEDPPGQQPTRILAEGGVMHFGGIESGRDTLQRSDLGFVMYFVRVDGGVRVRGQPLVFPDGSREHFDWEDFSCSSLNAETAIKVVCRRKSDSQLFHSTVTNGGLASFDLPCFDQPKRMCHYRLIGGGAIRPTHIAAN